MPVLPSSPQIARLADVASELGFQQDGGTLDAVAQSDVRWLERDAILVDGRLVVPEERGVDVLGDVAR